MAKVSIADIKRWEFEGKVKGWISPKNVAFSESLEQQRTRNAIRLQLPGRDYVTSSVCVDTDDQDIVDYMHTYLTQRKALTEINIFEVLEDIAWITENMLSSYALSMLEFPFAKHVSYNDLNKVLLRLRTIHKKADPLLDLPWKSFIIEASHYNDWGEDQVKEILAPDVFAFITRIRMS